MAKKAPEADNIGEIEGVQRPFDQAESVKQALNRLKQMQEAKGPLVSLPNGLFADATDLIGMTYEQWDTTKMLGDPRIILKDPKVGCKYVWKRRADKQTAAWIRAGILRPIEVDEIDTTNPIAEYVEDVTPSGHYVAWESLGLFEMPPKWAARIYGAPERLALSRLATQTATFSDRIDKATSGSYKGQLVVSDPKSG